MKLNLGCCDRNLAGWVNVDLIEPCDQKVDLSRYPWPWKDSTASEIRCYDVIEHLPSKIETMNQIWRVLIPGGAVDIIVPLFTGVGAVCDPTHVTFWSLGDFEYYLKGNFARERFRRYYGIKADFAAIKIGPSERTKNKFGEPVDKAQIILRAIK